MFVFEIAPFVIVALLSAAAVFSHLFDDNLLQRIGLSAVSLGAAMVVYLMLDGSPLSVRTFVLFGYGTVLYGAGTSMKVAAYKRHTRIARSLATKFPPIPNS